MRNFWLAFAATALAALAGTSAQATLFTFDIIHWVGDAPPTNPDAADVAHFIVDDQFGGTLSSNYHPTGIWTYGNEGSYFGQPFQDAFIDIYNDYWDGGFDITPYTVTDDGNTPDYDYLLSLYGPSMLGGTADAYHIVTGTHDFDGFDNWGNYLGTYSVTIAEADAAPSPTPEPAVWAMMLGGFGLIGAALRQRRRTTVSFG